MPAAPTLTVPVRMLGQSGCRIDFAGTIVYLDPYLSHSVQLLDAPDLERLLPIAIAADRVDDADWVLLTHEHIDHCDPHTLPALAEASPSARFMGPPTVLAQLAAWGIAGDRLQPARESWQPLAEALRVHAVPAAHPDLERDAAGNSRYVGYVLEFNERRLYLAGDTGLCQAVIDPLLALRPLATAMLPVNEQNFFRAQRGIIGNMSVREAYGLAEVLGVETLVPVHWDMFAINSVSPAEMQAVFAHLQPNFRLLLQPEQLPL